MDFFSLKEMLTSQRFCQVRSCVIATASLLHHLSRLVDSLTVPWGTMPTPHLNENGRLACKVVSGTGSCMHITHYPLAAGFCMGPWPWSACGGALFQNAYHAERSQDGSGHYYPGQWAVENICHGKCSWLAPLPDPVCWHLMQGGYSRAWAAAL